MNDIEVLSKCDQFFIAFINVIIYIYLHDYLIDVLNLGYTWGLLKNMYV